MNLTKYIIRLLTFKLTKNEMLEFNHKHLLAGIIGTWIVGMGRYWDDPKANLLQHLGLGSVVYIFVLAVFIWLIILPFKIEKWTYKTVLTFIALTSFPAIFYAIPVERFFSISIANQMNVWFLSIVALWRLLLLYYFIKHFTGLSAVNVITITLMPICLIISVLTMLNWQNVVFSIMSGIREPSPDQSKYGMLFLLTVISAILSIPLLIVYVVAIYISRQKK